MTNQPFTPLIPFVKEKFDEVEWVRVRTPDGENPKRYVSPIPERTSEMKTLRLDMEFGSEKPSLFTDTLTEELRSVMTDQMSGDIADLLVNGDVESNDPLLKVINGEVKMGRRLSDVNFSGVIYDVEYHSKKDTYEWTVYVALEPVYD